VPVRDILQLGHFFHLSLTGDWQFGHVNSAADVGVEQDGHSSQCASNGSLHSRHLIIEFSSLILYSLWLNGKIFPKTHHHPGP